MKEKKELMLELQQKPNMTWNVSQKNINK